MIRISKLAILALIAFYFTLVVFNNTTDFNSNYQFVRHVLMMDSTFPGNSGMWRAINAPALHLAFYNGIIVWEYLTTILLWIGVFKLYRALRYPAPEFNAAKTIGIAALLASLALWLGAFTTVGGEWFLMWQSHSWNGLGAAFQNSVLSCFALLILIQPDTDSQP